MSFLSRLRNPFSGPKAPPLLPLWEAIVAEARDPSWYLRHGVADTIDGRFDMVALVTSLVMLRLEANDMRAETAWLTECFVADMDGSLRDIGVGDLVVGKHVSRMAGALGGRIGAYRTALTSQDRAGTLAAALVRNMFRGEDAGGNAPDMATAVLQLNDRIAAVPPAELVAGRLT